MSLPNKASRTLARVSVRRAITRFATPYMRSVQVGKSWRTVPEGEHRDDPGTARQGRCNAPEPRKSSGAGVVGLQLRYVRTPCGQSGSLRGLRLIPVKWRYLVLEERRDGAQSRPPVPLGKNTLGDAARYP